MSEPFVVTDVSPETGEDFVVLNVCIDQRLIKVGLPLYSSKYPNEPYPTVLLDQVEAVGLAVELMQLASQLDQVGS